MWVIFVVFAIIKDSHGNQLGPLRVWMNTIDIPGLAMTRSMGDKVGAQAGVICEAGSKPNYN